MDQAADDKSARHIVSQTAKLNIGSAGRSIFPYEDVTALLDSATKDLKVGQLIQLESFSLFDAMCAIVIMDPKMDTGMILDEYAARPHYDVNRLLNPKEFIWIIDQILIGQMTWLSGHALSQTLFTSCYILRVFEINLEIREEKDDILKASVEFVTIVLKPCVLAIAKTCALISSEMKKGQTYEEEDFMTNMFGISLYEQYPMASLVAMLDQAEYWMESEGARWIKATNNETEAPDLIKAVMERVHYARSLFLSLFQVLAPKCSMFLQAVPQLENVRKHVECIKATHALGIEVNGAFDNTIHRKLVTNTPPRATALLTSEETFDQLDQMCVDLTRIAKALLFRDATNLFSFFVQFAGQKPAPGAFPRSVLQTALYSDGIIMGSRKVQEVIRDSIQATVTPASWLFESFDTLQHKLEGTTTTTSGSSSNVLESIPEHEEMEENDELSLLKRQTQAKVVLFVDKAIKPFVDTLQLAGQNTSRQRRNLRKIVQLWETFQDEAEAFDDEIHTVADEILAHEDLESYMIHTAAVQEGTIIRPFYFVSWVYHMKLFAMEWLLLLGFELELYSTFEISMIYGYVECVLGAHSQHLLRIQRFSESEKKHGENPLSKKRKKKKKKPLGAGQNTFSTPVSVENAQSAASTTQLSLEIPNATTAATTVDYNTKNNTTPTPTPGSVGSPSTLDSHPLELASTPTIRVMQEIITVRLQLACGEFLVLAALTKVGHLTTTPPYLASHGLNDLETLHQHRFKAFHHLSSPETLSYEAYLQRLNCGGFDAWQILTDATNYFSEAKSHLDRLQSMSTVEARVELSEETWRKDIKDMIKVCIASKLAIVNLLKDPRIVEQKEYREDQEKRAAIKKGKAKHGIMTTSIRNAEIASKRVDPPYHFKNPARKPHFEWKYHAWWPVVSLV
ncbi:Mak10 subunit, NatC N-terminal acetyltransferase-domain-containing protein [Lobosporangium transversale]|uniref:Mak10 subunit, NatC N-terminal acetyltransferase-domain-containing protein n=1 Tax=Lobosporangium transversale TaxID=64571 RepID=A0A1Y2GWH3_9FUNG|nr:Mak10 subunit, NatC N-terminal acetyltransferase-domain-containing protein [Lobosporangium transversale]ORZ21043.1 Mak10 subunit, NatC N-terminal acetyltransferase-domain-containing protein [Lobosporangium transversale]|eukprot:XP_021882952.1 Mak10 subunit, NatC N-terminal acetyltransferase-domain-containing protein [Lobosporangium transversale]